MAPPSEQQPGKAPTFKEQLDQAALEARGENQQPQEQPSMVEKVSNTIPGASKIIGAVASTATTNNTSENTVAAEAQAQQEREERQRRLEESPPHRGEHDLHIEEFVRDQHRSKNEDGTPAT